MSIQKRSTQERTAHVRPKYHLLGVDTDGAHHIHDTTTETVHIVHPDGSRGRRLLDGGTVDDYVAAVENAQGWDDQRYGVDLVEMLAEILGDQGAE
jgi:hypothetical protein